MKKFNINPELGCKVENPIIQILIKHLKIEAKIFEAKKDIYSLNWALLALTNVGEENDKTIKSSITSLEDEANKIINGKEFDLTAELSIKFALGTKILALKKKKNSLIVESMKIILKKLEEKKWFKSQETTSMILFLLSDDNRFSLELDTAYKWLYAEHNQFVENKNYQNMIDSSLALLSYNKDQIKVPFKEMIGELEQQSIERISKFLICVTDNGKKEYLREVIPLLEHKINNKFENWIFPNIEMSLFEGINLANANLPEEEIKVIMDNFRKNHVGWTKFIDVTENGLLLKNVCGIRKIPAFNVKEDALSLMSLLKAGRKTVYQLNEKEHELATESIREHKEGYVGIKKKQINCLFYFSLFLMASIFLFSTYSIGILPNLIFELLKAPSIYSLVKVSGYWVIFGLLMIYFYRIGNNLISKGEINKKELILLFPVVKETYSWIKGDKNDD